MTNLIETPHPQVAESAGTAMLLLAHGSLDPQSQESTRTLARAVRLSQACRVEVAYLRYARPRARHVVRTLAETGHDRVIVVPLLLTSAFHARVDLPRALSDTSALVPIVTPVLGSSQGVPDGRLVAALRRRLVELNVAFDAVVVAAAGSSDRGAYASVTAMASALGADLGLPCLAGFASTASPTPGEAVAQLRLAGASRIVVASYCFAPGLLFRRAADSSTAAGAVGVSEPLGDAPELVELVLERFHEACDVQAGTRVSTEQQ
ncbi:MULTISPECIES: sirohydrochlorin chelatase [unclassified Streptomyces]|uniref:sirohydrochlorin chelatase n=1 Tax=unclassified Streptomyces TaxID=2593676 RepID=UPI002258A27C|nr:MULTISPECIES: CbiX/SirB N-terminal domain-containing protein [unclassified Streptomyces]MCX4552949.1 sirohydrochlorin chelatase [Streptomyces sp. NBC_01500]WSC24276.1 sirohydrochlorin chelatase [Streptomyces sp. NBC_01766]WSV58161.1 sirohydrochlorin chelatase [Streptomyces sp. NBC_01014]